MIPRKIHYCWLSGGEIPEMLQKCMATWKEVLPDYELVLWDQKKFDINSVDFVKEAVSVKKWAFAADYIRLYAVYTEGGIYMDMDVLVKKTFDSFLGHDFFSAVELYPPGKNDKNKIYVSEDGSVVQRIAGIALQAAVFGAKAGHPFLKGCLKWYENRRFILPDGSFFNQILSTDIYATIAQTYGFRYKNEEQNLTNNMKIYSTSTIAPHIWNFDKNSFAVHCCAGSWRGKSLLTKYIKDNNFVRKIFGKKQTVKTEDMYDFVKNSPIWD